MEGLFAHSGNTGAVLRSARAQRGRLRALAPGNTERTQPIRAGDPARRRASRLAEQRKFGSLIMYL